MLLWRISMFRSLNGDGGLASAGRWHDKGRRVVYTSEHPAITLLEMIVHTDRQYLPTTYQLLKIRGPDNLKVGNCGNLEKDWQKHPARTQAIGNNWLARLETPILKVPCAVAPESWNYLINPVHPDAARIEIKSAQIVPVDARLLMTE
jgi:RES domain-containing protein